jgi:hypothetical protein
LDFPETKEIHRNIYKKVLSIIEGCLWKPMKKMA